MPREVPVTIAVFCALAISLAVRDSVIRRSGKQSSPTHHNQAHSELRRSKTALHILGTGFAPAFYED